jgi:hypothetical protein
MGFILSVSTIPTRIDYLIKIIPMLRCRYKHFVINICTKYKRFGDFKIPKELLKLCKQDKRIVFQFMDDLGPINKLVGGFKFMKKKRLYNDRLIIIDDDTLYNPELFYSVMEDKTKNNITTGSGFNFNNDQYEIVTGSAQMVEGYASICFDYNQNLDFINWYVGFYKHFNFKSDNIIDKYLTASFLGDDFIISSCYGDKWAIGNGRQLIQPQGYGFQEDALHKNNEFGSNMGSYKFLKDNIEILNQFKLKHELNRSILQK